VLFSNYYGNIEITCPGRYLTTADETVQHEERFGVTNKYPYYPDVHIIHIMHTIQTSILSILSRRP